MIHADARLLAIVRDRYDIDVVSAERLGGEVDINVKLTDANGQRLFLKATTPTHAEREHWQWQVIDSVSRVDPDLPVPRIIRARHGSLATRFELDGTEVEAAVMSWLPGTAMGRADGVDARTRVDLGVRAAQLFAALQNVDARAIPRTHHWDVRAFRPALTSGLGAVTDASDHAAVRAILSRCAPLVDRLEHLPTAVVHQDLNDFNVLVASDTQGRTLVSGVIDFGDTIHGLRVAEVVVASAYATLRQVDPVSAIIDVVRGFVSRQQLTREELASIYPLAALRLCVNGCTWTARTASEPSEYGASRMAYTWPVIHALASVDPDEVTTRLNEDLASSANGDTPTPIVDTTEVRQ